MELIQNKQIGAAQEPRKWAAVLFYWFPCNHYVTSIFISYLHSNNWRTRIRHVTWDVTGNGLSHRIVTPAHYWVIGITMITVYNKHLSRSQETGIWRMCMCLILSLQLKPSQSSDHPPRSHLSVRDWFNNMISPNSGMIAHQHWGRSIIKSLRTAWRKHL